MLVGQDGLPAPGGGNLTLGEIKLSDISEEVRFCAWISDDWLERRYEVRGQAAPASEGYVVFLVYTREVTAPQVRCAPRRNSRARRSNAEARSADPQIPGISMKLLFIYVYK